VILTIILRLITSTYSAFMEGLRGDGTRRRPSSATPRAVAMVRDPVCGTFVVRERAVSLADGRAHVYFCSEKCRDAFRAKSA
jgi:YHS domain-containing protein